MFLQLSKQTVKERKSGRSFSPFASKQREGAGRRLSKNFHRRPRDGRLGESALGKAS